MPPNIPKNAPKHLTIHSILLRISRQFHVVTANIRSKSAVEVVTIGDRILRAKVAQVTDFAEARLHAARLTTGLRELKGAGLAANQLGIDANIFVAEVRRTELFPDRPESPLHVLVNAEILEHSTTLINDWEGCFSVPGLLGIVPRYGWITVRYSDLDGNTHSQRFEDYLARVFQHEIDHLAGRIYLDRMPTMLTLTTRDNYLKTLSKAKSGESDTE